MEIYDSLLGAVCDEYDRVTLIKKSERGEVTLIRHRASGNRYIFRHFSGSSEVYRKLLTVSCPNLPQIMEVGEKEGKTVIFGKYINRYYLRHAPALLLGILALLMVDYIQLLVPQLYRLVINGVNLGQVVVRGETMPFTKEVLFQHICLPMIWIVLFMVVGRFLWRICFFGTSIRVQADLREKISMLRKEIPDIALRTTLISGFPGETNENHEECVDFVANMKFERLGVFPYSPEEGTPAAEYDRQLPDEIKQEWADEIMQTEQNVIFAQNEEMIGRKLSVIVDGYLPEDGVYVGRTYRDAPEIDGCLFFEAPYEIISGTILPVLVTDANGYDLIGEILPEEDD